MRTALIIAALLFSLSRSPIRADDIPDQKPRPTAEDIASSHEDEGPGWFGRLGGQTRSFFARTGQMFKWQRGSRPVSEVSHRSAKPAKSRFSLGALFQSNEPQEPRTVTEWMDQRRPTM